MHGANDDRKSVILKPKLRRVQPSQPGWSDIAAGEWEAGRPAGANLLRSTTLAHTRLRRSAPSGARPVPLAGWRNKQPAGPNVISTSSLFTHFAGTRSVTCVGAILNSYNSLTAHFTGLLVMSQLIWWYVLFVQNKFRQGEIWVQLAFKAALNWEPTSAIKTRHATSLAIKVLKWRKLELPCNLLWHISRQKWVNGGNNSSQCFLPTNSK